MFDRRSEPRTLCAEKVTLEWTDRAGRSRRALADLDEISRSGTRLTLAHPIALNSPLVITHTKGQLKGCVRNCVAGRFGYVVGVRFDPDCRWSPAAYRPRYFDCPH